jgi:hypothetical protein
MPTAEAHMTRARGLHATRSNIRSENDSSSLPAQICRFFLFRWHRAHTCQILNVRTATSTDGAYVLRALSWLHMRVMGAGGRGCHTPAWPGTARFARSSYVSRALIYSGSTSADREPPCWRCMPCAPYVGQLGASWGPPTAAVTRPDDRGVRA